MPRAGGHVVLVWQQTGSPVLPLPDGDFPSPLPPSAVWEAWGRTGRLRSRSGTGVTLREGGAGTRPSSLDQALAAGTVEWTGRGIGGTDIVVPACGDMGSCSRSPEPDGIGEPLFCQQDGLVFLSGAWGSPGTRWHSCLAQLASVWNGAVPGSYRSVQLFVQTRSCQVLVVVPQAREVLWNALW